MAEWARKYEIRGLTTPARGEIGKIAGRLMRADGKYPHHMPSPRWGQVNAYPESYLLKAWDLFQEK